jgi:hypothetical protein
MRHDPRAENAREAAVLQVLAEELRELIDAHGEAGEPLAAWPVMLERVAAEILVGQRRPSAQRALPGPVH